MNRTDDLLSKMHQINAELRAEDAFVAPQWFHQQRSWVEDPVHSDNRIYNYPSAIRIRGPLRREVLQQSLQQILHRHNVLRSVFRVVDREVVQIITPTMPVNIPIVDLSGSSSHSVDDHEARARQIATSAALQPFDLSYGPLLRAALLRLDLEDHILLLTTHHLIYDDWSSGILMRELIELYSAGLVGRAASLRALSFTYGDFARWLQMQMQGQKLENRLDFWSRELAGGNDFHHLPTDNPRPKRRTYRGQCALGTIPEDVTYSLRMLSLQERVSLFMVLVATFQGLLHRYSGDEDIGVGSCAANRLLSQVEGLIGRFGNDVVLRTDVSGNPRFSELLARVRKTTLTAFSYQDIPFGKLLNELHSEQTGRNPLFQVMIILQDVPKPTGEMAEFRFSFFPLELGTAKYDLNVWLRPQRGLEVVFEYNSDLFEAATMERLLGHYQQSLALVGRNPDARISELPGPNREPEFGSKVTAKCLPSLTVNGAPSRLSGLDDVEAKLVAIWESVLARRPISVTEDYFELGGTSVDAVRLFNRIVEEFGIYLPLSVLLRATTIRELSKVIRAGGSGDAAAPSSCLVEIQHDGKRPPFFCVHGAGGNVLHYRDLAHRLGAGQPFYGLQAQGLDGKRPYLTRIEDMAALYLKEIQNVQPEGPYFVGGYCGGGTVALEMAQQLHAQGQDVSLLALIDCYNWAKLKPGSLSDDVYFYVQKTLFRCRNLHLLNRKDKLRLLRRALGKFRRDGLSPDKLASRVSGNGHQASTPVGLHDVIERAALSYVPKPYPGRILHFCPIKQYAKFSDPELGWDGFAANGVEKIVLPVYPIGMLSEPNVQFLAAELKKRIEFCLAKTRDFTVSCHDMVG